MTTYIRGAGGVEVDKRRLARVVAGLVAAALIALIVALTAAAIDRTARDSRLRHAGVLVQVSVLRCVGVASGTGITASGYTCRGAFTLDGRRHTAVIRGSSALRLPGQRLSALVDPADASVLATARSVARSPAAWRAFAAPAALASVLVAAAATLLWRAGRSRRGDVEDPPTVTGDVRSAAVN